MNALSALSAGKCVAFVQFCGRGSVCIFMCVWHKNTHRCARTLKHSHWCVPLVYAGWVSKQRTCRRQGTLSAARCIARVVCACICVYVFVHTCMQGVCYCVCSYVCRRLHVDVRILVWIHITNQLCFLLIYTHPTCFFCYFKSFLFYCTISQLFSSLLDFPPKLNSLIPSSSFQQAEQVGWIVNRVGWRAGVMCVRVWAYASVCNVWVASASTFTNIRDLRICVYVCMCACVCERVCVCVCMCVPRTFTVRATKAKKLRDEIEFSPAGTTVCARPAKVRLVHVSNGCLRLLLSCSHLSPNLFLEIVLSESFSVSLDSISCCYEQCVRNCCARVILVFVCVCVHVLILVFVCVCVHVLQITFAHPAETHDARVHMQMHIAKVSHKKDRDWHSDPI